MESIILEVKAATGIADAAIAQTVNYLAASRCRLGLVINFGRTLLEHKRIVF